MLSGFYTADRSGFIKRHSSPEVAKREARRLANAFGHPVDVVRVSRNGAERVTVFQTYPGALVAPDESFGPDRG